MLLLTEANYFILYRTVGNPASLKRFLFIEMVQMKLGKQWWRKYKMEAGGNIFLEQNDTQACVLDTPGH